MLLIQSHHWRAMQYLLIPELSYLFLQFFDLPTNTANIWQWIFAIPLGGNLILTFVKRKKASIGATKGNLLCEAEGGITIGNRGWRSNCQGLAGAEGRMLAVRKSLVGICLKKTSLWISLLAPLLYKRVSDNFWTRKGWRQWCEVLGQ